MPSTKPILRRRSTLLAGALGVLAVVAAVGFLAGGSKTTSAQERLERVVVDCGVTGDYSTEIPTDVGGSLHAPQLSIELYGDDEMSAAMDEIDCVAQAIMSDSTYIKFSRTSVDDPLSVTENGFFIFFQFDSIEQYLWLNISLDD